MLPGRAPLYREDPRVWVGSRALALRTGCGAAARGPTRYLDLLRSLDDSHAMLKQRGDWVPLGSADEQKPAPEGSVEASARSSDNPVGGWNGLEKGLRQVRHVRPAAHGGAWPGGSGAQPAQQPHARPLGPAARAGSASTSASGRLAEDIRPPTRKAPNGRRAHVQRGVASLARTGVIAEGRSPVYL